MTIDYKELEHRFTPLTQLEKQFHSSTTFSIDTLEEREKAYLYFVPEFVIPEEARMESFIELFEPYLKDHPDSNFYELSENDRFEYDTFLDKTVKWMSDEFKDSRWLRNILRYEFKPSELTSKNKSGVQTALAVFFAWVSKTYMGLNADSVGRYESVQTVMGWMDEHSDWKQMLSKETARIILDIVKKGFSINDDIIQWANGTVGLTIYMDTHQKVENLDDLKELIQWMLSHYPDNLSAFRTFDKMNEDFINRMFDQMSEKKKSLCQSQKMDEDEALGNNESPFPFSVLNDPYADDPILNGNNTFEDYEFDGELFEEDGEDFDDDPFVDDHYNGYLAAYLFEDDLPMMYCIEYSRLWRSEDKLPPLSIPYKSFLTKYLTASKYYIFQFIRLQYFLEMKLPLPETSYLRLNSLLQLAYYNAPQKTEYQLDDLNDNFSIASLHLSAFLDMLAINILYSDPYADSPGTASADIAELIMNLEKEFDSYVPKGLPEFILYPLSLMTDFELYTKKVLYRLLNIEDKKILSRIQTRLLEGFHMKTGSFQTYSKGLIRQAQEGDVFEVHNYLQGWALQTLYMLLETANEVAVATPFYSLYVSKFKSLYEDSLIYSKRAKQIKSAAKEYMQNQNQNLPETADYNYSHEADTVLKEGMHFDILPLKEEDSGYSLADDLLADAEKFLIDEKNEQLIIDQMSKMNNILGARFSVPGLIADSPYTFIAEEKENLAAGILSLCLSEDSAEPDYKIFMEMIPDQKTRILMLCLFAERILHTKHLRFFESVKPDFNIEETLAPKEERSLRKQLKTEQKEKQSLIDTLNRQKELLKKTNEENKDLKERIERAFDDGVESCQKGIRQLSSDLHKKEEENQQLQENMEELYKLRSLMFSMNQQEEEQEQVSSSLSSDELAKLDSLMKEKNVFVVGGHIQIRRMLKELYPSVHSINSPRFSKKDVAKADYILFFYNYLSHSIYDKMMDVIRKEKIAFDYASYKNLEQTQKALFNGLIKLNS